MNQKKLEDLMYQSGLTAQGYCWYIQPDAPSATWRASGVAADGKDAGIWEAAAEQPEPVARLHFSGADTYFMAEVEVLAVQHLQGKTSPVDVYLAAPTAPEGAADAYGYASRLARALWKNHYKDIAPEWKPLDALMGVLTQIDNMTAELVQPAPEGEPVQKPFGYLWPTGRHPEFRFTQQKRGGVEGMPVYTTPPAAPSVLVADAAGAAREEAMIELASASRELGRLRAERDALRADAARYRILADRMVHVAHPAGAGWTLDEVLASGDRDLDDVIDELGSER